MNSEFKRDGGAGLVRAAGLFHLLFSAPMGTSAPDIGQDLTTEYSISGILAVLTHWYPVKDQYSYEQLTSLMCALLNLDRKRDSYG